MYAKMFAVQSSADQTIIGLVSVYLRSVALMTQFSNVYSCITYHSLKLPNGRMRADQSSHSATAPQNRSSKIYLKFFFQKKYFFLNKSKSQTKFNTRIKANKKKRRGLYQLHCRECVSFCLTINFLVLYFYFRVTFCTNKTKLKTGSLRAHTQSTMLCASNNWSLSAVGIYSRLEHHNTKTLSDYTTKPNRRKKN